MITNNIKGLKKAGVILLSLFFISSVFLSSCEKDDDEKDNGAPFFTIEGQPSGLSAGIDGKEQSYVVRSNRYWQVVAQNDGDWVRSFPNEGEDDGIFKIIVKENNTFDARTMNFAFIVDGQEQPVLFRVDQEQAVPALTIADIETGKNINQITQDLIINVKANVDYAYSTDATWLTFTQADIGSTSTDLIFTATSNEDANPRIATISFTCAQFPELNTSLVVTQEGKSEGTIVLFEDFNWLNYSTQIFYNTKGVVRYDHWTPDEQAKGWTSTLNTGSKDHPVYALIGCVKLGKTSYGGDIITPKLSGISGTQDVVVKFKSIPYKTKGGTQDDNFLNISIIGPGTISQSQFIIDNWPSYPSDAAEHEAFCASFWDELEAERSFTITGATSETQIKFLGGDYLLKGVGKGKNRVFLDDIKVLIPN